MSRTPQNAAPAVYSAGDILYTGIRYVVDVKEKYIKNLAVDFDKGELHGTIDTLKR